MFDKNYYTLKLVNLTKRLQGKKTDALNEILNVLQRYMKDEKQIIADSNEVQKRMEEAEKEDKVKTVILDKTGKSAKKVEELKEDKKK